MKVYGVQEKMKPAQWITDILRAFIKLFLFRWLNSFSKFSSPVPGWEINPLKGVVCFNK